MRGSKTTRFVYDPTLVDAPDRLAPLLPDAKAIIVRNRTQVRADLLNQAPNLKVVGRLGVGLDNIDLELCIEHGVEVCPASGANDISVAEYVITAALMLLRGAWTSTSEVSTGAWPRNDLIGREISGQILGCIGFGSIARETAKRAAALGMTVIAYDPFINKDDPVLNAASLVTLDKLLEEADVISLHTPLNDQTKNLIDHQAITKMKRDAILINAARGGIVDEHALASALRDSRLGGAALDVFHQEPLSAEAGQAFNGLKNVLLTPHIAGVTTQSNLRVSDVTVKNVLRVLNS